MKYGLYLPNFGPFADARLLADMARDAEVAGWDGFFLWDHIAGERLPMVDPWVALTAVALNTTRLRIGTTVTPLPRRRPWKVAREAVSLDQLSNGRMILGVGTGLGSAEWDDLGEVVDSRQRGEMLDEALEIITGLWQGVPFNFTGEYYQVHEALFLPKPRQAPHIPIWVGGFWPNKRPMRRAARWEGVFPLFQDREPQAELLALEAAIAFIRAHRQSTKPFDVVVQGITPGAEPGKAREMVEPYRELGVTWWLEPIAPYRLGLGFDEPWPLAALHERIRQGPTKETL